MLLPHNPQCVIPETFKRSFTSFIHTAGVSISLLEIRKRKLNAIRSSLLLHIVMSPDHSPSSLQERLRDPTIRNPLLQVRVASEPNE